MTNKRRRALGRVVVIPAALLVISVGVVMPGGLAAQDAGKKTATSQQDQRAQPKVDQLLRSLKGRGELVGSGVPPSRAFAARQQQGAVFDPKPYGRSSSTHYRARHEDEEQPQVLDSGEYRPDRNG